MLCCLYLSLFIECWKEMKDVQCKIFYPLDPLFVSVIKTRLLRTYMLNVSEIACKMKKKEGNSAPFQVFGKSLLL